MDANGVCPRVEGHGPEIGGCPTRGLVERGDEEARGRDAAEVGLGEILEEDVVAEKAGECGRGEVARELHGGREVGVGDSKEGAEIYLYKRSIGSIFQSADCFDVGYISDKESLIEIELPDGQWEAGGMWSEAGGRWRHVFGGRRPVAACGWRWASGGSIYCENPNNGGTQKQRSPELFKAVEILCLHSDRSCLQSPYLRKFASKSSIQTTDPFALSYLINDCGLRPEKAAAAVKYVRFKSPDKPNLVLKFFRNLGFSSSQIPKVIQRRPRLLISVPEKHFLPKISLLESNGFSTSDIAQVFLRAPELLHSSVENQLLPNLNFIKSVLLSDEKVVRAIRRSPFLLTCELETYLIPCIKILKENGVGDSSIIRLLLYHPTTIMTTHSQLTETVERVKQMGVAPRSTTFGVAIQAVRGISSETWESKIDAYKKWGWSEEVTLRAFTKSPWCMTLSEKKIAENMDYYVNQMGFEPLEIANRPTFLSFSLKKRIVPRDTVLQVLVSKGLIESRRMLKVLHMDDEKFRTRFVTPYEVEAPELSDLFLKMLALSEETDPEMGEKQS
ncbi:Transcription termination factor MTERF8, chloroplastic [Linum perenne]